jgi:hypothetical protein
MMKNTMTNDELLDEVVQIMGDRLYADRLALSNFLYEALVARYGDLSREELIAMIASEAE